MVADQLTSTPSGLSSVSNSSPWRVNALINIYRFLLGAGFTVVFSVFSEFSEVGKLNPGVSLSLSAAYLAFSLAMFVLIRLHKPSADVVSLSGSLVDVLFVVCLLYLSGGANSGLGILLVVSLLGVGVLLPKRTVTGVAAFASIAVLGVQLGLYAAGRADAASFTTAGVLGAVYFIAALLTSVLTQRVQVSEALAEKRGIDLANMAQLNDYIIQRMASGVIVADNNKDIRLINEAAGYLLGLPGRKAATNVDQLSSALASQVDQWLRSPSFEGQVFRVTASANVYPRFVSLGEQGSAGMLILLEDTSVMDQQAQHLKMTALGRLTASIAHEIRNPLGAISHAAQLLSESEHLDVADRRLTQIIRDNSVRTNTIIENVMQLTRRDQARSENLGLRLWLEDFLKEFCRTHSLDRAQVGVAIEPADVSVIFDPSHLHQILSNLCQNALKHGEAADSPLRFELRGGLMRESRGPFLDVIDFGQGISPDLAQQIFEPFFTTATKGTGLGLYIARELAESNRAHLDYVPVPTGGSCFRLTFMKDAEKNKHG